MVNQYSWDNFQTNQTQSQDVEVPKQMQPPQPANPIQSNNYSWGDFQNTSTYQGEPDPTAEESTFGYLTRNLASNTARLFETFNPVARVGNIQELLKTAVSKLPESTGILGKALHSLMGQERWDKMVYGNDLSPKIPTSSDLKEMTDTLTGGYTKPKTKGEERFQGFISDVGSTLRGGKSVEFINNLGIPAAANVAKSVVEGLGFGEDKSTWTKLAAWTSLSLLNNVNAPAYAANLMNRGRNGFSQNIMADVNRYQDNLSKATRGMLHGDPRSSLAQQQVAGIMNDISNGQTSMRDLMNRYDAINAVKRDKGLFQLSRSDRKAAIRNIDLVKNAVRHEIEELGQSNPSALENWKNGVQAFAVIHQSNAMTNWIQNIAKGPYAKILSGPTAGLFGISGYGASHAPVVGLAASSVTPALYKAGQVAYRVWNDPRLAQYYWEAINAAKNENKDVFIRSINSLNTEYNKKYKESLGGLNPSKKDKSKNEP